MLTYNAALMDELIWSRMMYDEVYIRLMDDLYLGALFPSSRQGLELPPPA